MSIVSSSVSMQTTQSAYEGVEYVALDLNPNFTYL